MSDRDKDTEILALRHRSLSWNVNAETPVRGSPPATGHSSLHCCTDSRYKRVARLTAERSVRVANPAAQAVAEWRRVIDFAKRHRLTPPGTRIEKRRLRGGDLLVRLLSGVHPNTRGDEPPALSEVVPMPTELRSLHPVVAALQADDRRLHMPASLRRRSLLILHGLVRETLRRGHDVREAPVPQHRYREFYDWKTKRHYQGYLRRDGELNVVIKGFACPVTISEAHPEAIDDVRRDRLVLALPAYQSNGRQYRWKDGKRRTVEGSLATVLRELELRADEAEQQRLAAEREAEEQQLLREQTMERARHLAEQAYYAGVLRQQAADWETARRLRAYCADFEAELAVADPKIVPIESSRQWLRWAQSYIAALDPLGLMPVMPDPPILTSDDLQPYL